MSQKIKHLPKALLLLFIFLFSGCEKENISEAENTSTEAKKISLQKFSVPDETNSKLTLDLNAALMISINNVKAKNLLAQTPLGNNLYKFSFDEKNGHVIKKDNYESYTFPVSRINGDNKIENIVFSSNGIGGYNIYLAKYPFTAQELPSLTPAQLLQKPPVFRNISLGKIGDPICIDYQYSSEIYEAEMDGNPTETVWITYETQCFDSGSSGTGPDGGTGTSGTWGTGTSGTTGSTNTHGSGGVIITTPTSTTPPPSTPCDELKKMSNEPLNKVALKNSETKTRNLGAESGFAFKIPTTAVAPPPETISSDPNRPERLDVNPFILTGLYYGFGHNHTDPVATKAFPMFSPADIRDLYLLYINNMGVHINVVPVSSFVVTMAVYDIANNKNVTFAIKIQDVAALAEIITNSETYPKLYSRLVKEYNATRVDGSLIVFEKNLLCTLSELNLGVTLYQGDSTLTNWKELVYNSETGGLTAVPCN